MRVFAPSLSKNQLQRLLLTPDLVQENDTKRLARGPVPDELASGSSPSGSTDAPVPMQQS
jgi:hypothetical protein